MTGLSHRFALALVALLALGLCIAPAKDKKKKGELETDRSEYYKKWLKEDVVYIISEEEKKVFKSLSTEEEREKFIEQFWYRRNPDPRSSYNEFKEEHYRRIAYANERFASGLQGWRTDRGRMYITFGPPVEIESHPTGGMYQRQYYEGGGSTSTYPFERWRYRHIDGVGDDVEIEFVDKTMSGEYRMAMSHDEKDALMHVPGVGLTMNETMGLSSKEDRPYFSPGNIHDPIHGGHLRLKDMPFQRMERYFNLQRPPAIKFKDLQGIVSTNIKFQQFPYSVRMDYIRLSGDKVLVPVTIQINNGDLEFKREFDFNRAAVNVYGLVTNLTGRIMAEFEHVITVEYLDQFFEQGKQSNAVYQKIIGLPPGQRFKLELVLKDVHSGEIGVREKGLLTPKYDNASLQMSSVILAEKIEEVPYNSNRLDQFIIGQLKVRPNVTSEYVGGQNLVPYVQVYNAHLDQASLEPSITVTYRIKKGRRVVRQVQDLQADALQFFSGVRLVVLGKIPLESIDPGPYTLEVEISDRLKNETVMAKTKFTVTSQPQTAELR